MSPYILNVIGLILDVIGAILIASYVIFKDNLEENPKILIWLFKEGTVFSKFEKNTALIGIALIIIGFVIQIYSNWIQYNA